MIFGSNKFRPLLRSAKNASKAMSPLYGFRREDKPGPFGGRLLFSMGCKFRKIRVGGKG